MKTHAFGVDLGGTTTKIGLFTVDGTLVKKVEFPTDTKDQGEAILPNIARAVDEMMVGRGIAPFEVVGIGMGVPGAVLNDNYVLRCANLNNWGGPVSDELGALTGFTVKLANDANAAALGEYFNGGGKGYNSIVFTTIGTGIGSGIIIDGKLIPGCNGAAGEIGHIKVAEPNEDICGCGKSGCLERYASANGIVRQAIKALSSTSTPSVLREFEELTCKDVIDSARDGDPIALEVFDNTTKLLGKAFATVSCVCDPDIFVIGGGMSKAGNFLLDRIRKHYREYAFPFAEDTEFALAKLENDAGIYGAVHMILK